MLRLHYDLAVVEHGPLPPHERTWRHPSELAAEEHAVARAETSPATTRMFAFTTGTLGLLAVGLLMMAVTPNRSGAPVAISATTTPSLVPDTVTAIATVATGPTERAPLGLRGAPEALATPIGEGRYAVITTADLAASSGGVAIGDAVEVEVPSGRLHDARIVGRSGDTVLVELERVEPGIEIADDQPSGEEIVTVLAQPPVTIALADLAGLDVEEGTAVLDDAGELVGLCSQDHDAATRLMMVREELPPTDPTDPTDTAREEHPIDAEHPIGDVSSDDESGDELDDELSEVPVGATTGG